jgi:lipopolysaccharide export system protein LptA
MRNRVERLRVWLLGSAIFLMLVIAAFIVSARYVARIRKLAALPAKLGIDVKGGANGYTLSRTVGSRTIFTLHAARWEQHTDGKISLHDVSVVLYGKNGDRHDRIYGDEFEYDTKQGLVRALGLVHIDLEATEAEEVVKGGAAKVLHAATAAAPRVLHITTSGLVYLEHLGVAATSEPIEFESGGLTGHATGADYSSDTGTLMLHSAVSMSGLAGKRPVEVTAATAELDSRSEQTWLTHAKYTSQGQTAEADAATLHTRPDGSLARVEAQGHVTAQANGATVVSQRADVALDAASQPQTAVLTGSVGYSAEQPLRDVKAQADAAIITFDDQAKPQPKHAVFTGGVHMVERTRATVAAGEPWSVRDLTAAKVEAALAPAGPGQSQLRDVEATGNSRVTMVNNGSLASSRGEGTTELSADDLKAHMFAADDAKQPPQLETLAGHGHTVLHQVTAKGTEQISTGDTLDATFRPQGAVSGTRGRPALAAARGAGSARIIQAGSAANRQATDLLLSAVQQGHFTMMRRVPPKTGSKPGTKEDVQHVVAQRAAYDGDLDRMTLTGGVQLMDAGSVLWANQVALDYKTGDSEAVGGVKVNLVQDNSTQQGAGRSGATTEPTHIVADRADRDHATGVATFHGNPVRMWQGASQVQAPVIELASTQNWLIARGEASTGGSVAQQAAQQTAQVHAVLVSTGSGGAVAPAAKAEAANSGPAPRGCANATAKPGAGNSGAAVQMANVVRITSGRLVYSGTSRQADFTGGIRAETVDGTVRANEVVATLQQTAPGESTGKADVPSMTGRLERVVASGAVDIEQPGSQATGERLVYTESDQLYVLTGDNNAPPKAVEADGTTTTGAELRFHAGDCSVEALGAAPGQPTQRVRTVSRVRGDQELVKRP